MKNKTNRSLIWTLIFCTIAIVGTIIYVNFRPKEIELSINGTSLSVSKEQSDLRGIKNNLITLGNAANKYFFENNVTRVSYDKLAEQSYEIKNLKPVAGESYPVTFELEVPIETTGGKYGVISIDF